MSKLMRNDNAFTGLEVTSQIFCNLPEPCLLA